MKKGKKLNVWLVMSVFLLVMGRTCFAGQIFYVDADAPGSTHGSNWEEAFNYLQDALWVAQYGSGNEIRVAQGVYKPNGTDRGASFQLIVGVTIKGSYAGYGEPDPDARDVEKYETILSGDLFGDDAEVARPEDLLDEPTRTDNSYNVVTVGAYTGPAAVLDGFTITGGNSDYSGGGLLIDYGNAIIVDCTFINNSATYNGGAMAFWNSRAIFTRCSFIANAASYNGGAVCLDGCDTCRDSLAEFKDCRFINNYAGGDGGALYNASNTLTSLVNCVIAGNTTKGSGGGLYQGSPYYDCTLTNCTLTGNWASNGGGAVYDYQRYYYSKSTLTNCILWDNKPDEIKSGATSVTYSDVKGGWSDIGNIGADPCFVQPGYWVDVDDTNIIVEPDDEDAVWIDGDYHLLADSPCVNTGDPSYIAAPSGGNIPTEYFFTNPQSYIADSSETDLDGRPRIIGGRVDMGAYECRPTIGVEAKITPHNINLTGKGKWITCYIRLPEDYDVADIEPGSIRLEDTIRPLWMWFDEAKQVAMVKFKRCEVQQMLEPDDVQLTVSGEFGSGTLFEANVTIKVVGKGRKS